MPDLPPGLDDRLRGLERAVRDLERRMAAIEAAGPPTPAGAPADDSSDDDVTAALPESGLAAGVGTPTSGALTLVGRTFVVLGGAFLLRALTESGRVPVALGVSLGFTYALVWLAAAFRAGATRPASATFHGLTAMLVAMPLLVEATARFQAYGVWTTAVLLAFVAVCGSLVASRRDLPVLFAIVTTGTLVTLAVIATATARPVPSAVVATAMALVVAMTASRSVAWLAWPVALVANIMILALVARGGGASPLAPPGAVLAATGAFVGAYAWIIAGSLLGTRRTVTVFDVVQATAVILVGVTGAVVSAGRIGPAWALVAGLCVLAAGAASYAVGLGLSIDRPDRRPAVHLFMFAALAIIIIGAASLMSGLLLMLWFAGLAAVLSWVGGRRLQPILMLHGALYALAATVAGGLPGLLVQAWLVPLDAWVSALSAPLAVAGAAAVGVLGPRLPAGALGGRLTIIARTINAAVFSAILASWVLLAFGPLLVTLPAPGPLAALRSAMLAAAAVALAAAGLGHRARAFGRLAYPSLGAGAAKLVIEDFWRSGPVMIFVALACYGLALILTARLRSRARSDERT